MSPEIQNDKYILCAKCGTENSFGNYECINCREVPSYGDAEVPEISSDDASVEDDALKKRNKFQPSVL